MLASVRIKAKPGLVVGNGVSESDFAQYGDSVRDGLGELFVEEAFGWGEDGNESERRFGGGRRRLGVVPGRLSGDSRAFEGCWAIGCARCPCLTVPRLGLFTISLRQYCLCDERDHDKNDQWPEVSNVVHPRILKSRTLTQKRRVIDVWFS